MKAELNTRVNRMIGTLEREDRIPVLRALYLCDGTLLDFQSELAGQCWDFPGLNVQEVIDILAFDLA